MKSPLYLSMYFDSLPYVIRVGFMEEVALGINFKAANICLLAEGKAFLLGRSSIIPFFTSTEVPSSTQAISAAPGQLEAILATCHPNACPSLTLLFSSKADEHILWPSHNSCPPHLDFSALHTPRSATSSSDRTVSHIRSILFFARLISLSSNPHQVTAEKEHSLAFPSL